MHWYVIHTKPRQEQRALDNLTQQGFECYLPLFATEKVRRGTLTVVQEPLFARYLFIHLDGGQGGKSWVPIRSTIGVSRLVSFGSEPAKVEADLIEALRSHDAVCQRALPERMFHPGEPVQIKTGPFAGLPAIYQMSSGEGRAMVLIELLHKPCQLTVAGADIAAASLS
jgi:transcriptional antiterminator RfaH